MQAELRRRLIIGPTLALATIIALAADIGWGGHWGALLVALIITLTASWELPVLAANADLHISRRSLLFGNLALLAVAIPTIGVYLGPAGGSLALGLILVLSALAQMRHPTERFFRDLAATLLGLLYIGWCMHLWVVLAHDGGGPPRGAQILLMTLAICKIGDTSAFFGGRSFGRHKMAPRLSPGKTWEGAACGILGGIGAAYLSVYLVGVPWSATISGPFSGWWQPLVCGLIIAPVGMLGDLAESCLKRSGSVKDSSTAVPGFGGFLDIYDAILPSIPVALLLAQVLA